MPDIAGATSIRFRPGAAQAGKRVRLRVTGSNARDSEVAYSPWSTPVAAGNTSERRQLILANDPIAYFPLDADTVDKVGGHTLQTTGVVGGLNGGGGGGFSFVGSGMLQKSLGDNPAVPNGATADTGRTWDGIINLTQAFTLSAWVKGGSPSSTGYQTIAQMLQGFRGFGLNIYTTANVTSCWVRGWVGSGSTQIVAQAHIDEFLTGTWHHVAVTYDGSNVRLYVDGALRSTTAHTGGVSLTRTAAQPALSVGGFPRSDGPADLLRGDVDDVAVFTSALSAAELAAHIGADPTMTSGEDPTSHWPTRASGGSYTNSASISLMLDGAEQVPNAIDLTEFSGTLTIDTAPDAAEDDLVFWAMLAWFYDEFGNALGYAHTGLQWNNDFEDHLALNFGGASISGTEWVGSDFSVGPGDPGAPTLDAGPSMAGTSVVGALLTGTPADWTGETSVEHGWERDAGGAPPLSSENTVGYSWAVDTPYVFRMWISAPNEVSCSINGQLIRTLTVTGVDRIGDPKVYVQDNRSFHLTETVASWAALQGVDSASVDWFASQVTVDYQLSDAWRHPYRNVSVSGDAVQFLSPGARTTENGASFVLVTPITVDDPTLPTVDTLPTASGTALSGETLTATPGAYTGEDSVAGEWVRLTGSFAGGPASEFSGTVTDTDVTTLTYLLDADDQDGFFAYREIVTNAAGSVTYLSNTIGPVVVPEAPVDPIVSDTFTRANSTTGLGTSTSGHAWTNLHGRVFGISSNQAYKATTTIGETVSVVNANQRNVRLVADITVGATGNIDVGFALRARSADTYIIVGLTKRSGVDRVAVYTHIAGAYTQLGEYTPAGLVAGQTYELEVNLYGRNIVVSLDGVQRLSLVLTSSQDTSLTGTNDTRHGLRANNEAGNSRVDNFMVYPGNPVA